MTIKILISKILLPAALLIALFIFPTGMLSADGENLVNPYLDYEAFPIGEAAEDFTGKKVSFTGRMSVEINQHMLRGQKDHPYIQECYIDPDNRYRYIPQLVGYNIGKLPFDWSLYEDEHLRFYGTFSSISGPPKRAGSKVDESYTEIYFDIIDIEILPDSEDRK
jgi:hypothetical protein